MRQHTRSTLAEMREGDASSPVTPPLARACPTDATTTADAIEQELAQRTAGHPASMLPDVPTDRLPSMLVALRGARVSAPAADAAPTAPTRGPECDGRAYVSMLRGLSNRNTAKNAETLSKSEETL